jgi:hypothetical protein
MTPKTEPQPFGKRLAKTEAKSVGGKTKIKTRHLQYRMGNIDWIDIPNDWRKAKGIIAKRTETNAGLAQRDYSIPCECGSVPLMVVEGFWIWWCKTHNHPYARCCKEKEADEIRASERERCVKAILSLTEYEVEDDELDKGKRAMIDKKEAIDLIKNLDKSGVPQTRRVSGKELK